MLPMLDDARRWGVLYVLEGSTLGGRLLLDRVASLGITAAHGGAYLAAGERPPRRWHTFVQALARQDAASFDREAALDAARRTFSAASDCLA
jgi:heme oxygenase (biliverdin-IX-beta and delta-forming)